jgi:hypothetical protein
MIRTAMMQGALSLAMLSGSFSAAGAAATITPDAGDALRPGHHMGEIGAAPGAVIRIVIDRARQRAYVYRGDRLVALSTASTGKKGHPTPLGTFTILQKAERHRSNLYSNAPMPFMQRLTWDGIALHAGPLPGYPASHGCIRLPWAFARALFAATTLGATVEITDSGPLLSRMQMASVASAGPASPADAASAPALLIAAAPMPAPPILLALAAPPPAPFAKPPTASWREKSADDYVSWGTAPDRSAPGAR